MWNVPGVIYTVDYVAREVSRLKRAYGNKALELVFRKRLSLRQLVGHSAAGICAQDECTAWIEVSLNLASQLTLTGLSQL